MSTTKIREKTKIAIIGSRGIPAQYGGFEVFAQKIAERLSTKNIDVGVYCMTSLKKESYNCKGVHRVFIYTPRISFLEKFVFSSLSSLHAIFLNKAHVLFLLGVTGGAFLWLTKLFSIKSILNMDGIEWRRGKWSKHVRYALKALEVISVKSVDTVVADSRAIGEYVELAYGKDSFYIPYGVDNCDSTKKDWAYLRDRFSLSSYSYYLAVGRFVPENNFPMIIKGILNSRTKKKLIIVSDIFPSMNQDYLKNDDILFTGPIYDRKKLFALRKNAFAHIHGHSVGGTNPSLLEAIGSGNLTICYDVPYNREVMEDYGYYFKNEEELASAINFMESNSDKLQSEQRSSYYEKIMKEKYNWDIVTDKYLELINRLVNS